MTDNLREVADLNPRPSSLTEQVEDHSEEESEEQRQERQNAEAEAREKVRREKEARAQALTLEIIGDLPSAEVKPPENVLFVCKLNPVTEGQLPRLPKANRWLMMIQHRRGLESDLQSFRHHRIM